MNRGKTIVKNYISLLASQIISKLINFVANIYLLAHFLGIEKFGEYSTVLTFIGVFNFLSDLGVAQIVTREISKDKSHAEKYYHAFFTLEIILSVITFIIIFLSILILHNSYTQNEVIGIYITGIGICIGSLARPFSSVIYAEEKIEWVGLAIFLPSLVNLALVIYYTKLTHGNLITFFYVYLAINILTTLIYYFSSFKLSVPLKIKFDLKIWRLLLNLSLPMLVVMAFNILYNKIDILLIHFLKNDTAVGYYSLAYKFIDALILVPSSVGSALFPALVKTHIEDFNIFKDLFYKSIKYTQVITIGACIVTGLIAYKVLYYSHVENFSESVLPLQILLGVIALNGLYVIYTNMLIALTKMRILAAANMVALIINIVLNLFFIPKFGIVGAAWVSVITEAIVFLIYYQYSSKLFHINIDYIMLMKLALSVIILIGISYYLNKYNILIILPIYCILYALLILLFQVITIDELKHNFKNILINKQS